MDNLIFADVCKGICDAVRIAYFYKKILVIEYIDQNGNNTKYSIDIHGHRDIKLRLSDFVLPNGDKVPLGNITNVNVVFV